MAHTLSDILTLARDQLQDTRTPYRHSDEKLIRYLNMSLATGLRVRPDLFLPNVHQADYAYTTADLAVVFPVEFSYREAFVYYLVGTVSLEDDEFVADGRAAALLAQFKQKLTGTP
jgi:hypothetical protein